MELSPERTQARELYRHRVADYIAGLVVAKELQHPQPHIGYLMNEEIIS